MELRKKLLAVASLAFAAALSAGVAVSAGAEQTLDGFKIDATAVRISDTEIDGRNTSGLRFHTVTPDDKTAYTEAYTVLTVAGIEGDKKVNTQEWRTPDEKDATNGWNTVLMDIPAAYYTAEVTAQSFVADALGVVYQTGVAKTSIALTASQALNLGATDAKLYDYTAGAVEKITLSQASATAFVGDAAIQLTAETQPAGYGVVWATDDASVATVDNTGKVTIVGKGAAKITASMGGKVATFALTVYEKHEIDSVDEFMAIETDNAYVHYVLTSDIDFDGIVINETAGYTTIGTPEGMTAAGLGTYSAFEGILDGNGYALKNLTIKPMSGYTGREDVTPIGAATLFGGFTGTVKNLMAQFEVIASTVNDVRYAGFANGFGGGATASNCVFDMKLSHYVASNNPAAPLAGMVYANGNTTTTIENCVGILREVTYARNGGFATGLVGRVSGDGTLVMKNSYAVEVKPKDNGPAEYYESHAIPSDWVQTALQATNVSAYGELYDMYAAAKTGMKAENGWNSFWTVDTANQAIKFGNTTVFDLDVYEISTAAQFLAMPTNDATAYCVLTQDIDFSGIVVNGSPETMGVGFKGYVEKSGGQATKGTQENFLGVLDGRGYALKNVLVRGANNAVANNIYASLIFCMNGTLKNLAVDMAIATTEQGGNTAGIKEAGLISRITNANAVVENCYVKLTTPSAAYGTQTPVAGICGFANQTSTFKNCIAVFVCPDDFKAVNGGYGAIAGRCQRAAKITNCYGVVLSKDNAQTAKLYTHTSYTSGYVDAVVTNSTAHTTLADMFTAASNATTGIVAANGWNSFWTVDAENNTLKFGQTVVYQPQAE